MDEFWYIRYRLLLIVQKSNIHSSRSCVVEVIFAYKFVIEGECVI
jgi:hypothetical protein